MKNILIFIFVFFAFTALSQTDTGYNREVNLCATFGADTYLAHPIVGLGYIVQITDFNHKFVLNWQNEVVNDFGNNLLHFNLDILHKGKSINYGISPFGFWWYVLPNGVFTPTIGISIAKTLNDTMYFKITSSYYFALANKPGITATINYKLKKLNKI